MTSQWADLPRRLTTICVGIPILWILWSNDTLRWLFFQGTHAVICLELTFLTSNSQPPSGDLLSLVWSKRFIAQSLILSNISVIWHGSLKPIADYSNPYWRHLNSRIVVSLIGKRKESFGNFYLIRPGASVNKISTAMGVSTDQIRRLNGLGANGLAVYQPIRLKKDGEIKPDYNLVVPADIKSGSDFIYTVEPGDDLSIVAQKFNVPEELIMEQNGLTSTQLEPGTRLII